MMISEYIRAEEGQVMLSEHLGRPELGPGHVDYIMVSDQVRDVLSFTQCLKSGKR